MPPKGHAALREARHRSILLNKSEIREPVRTRIAPLMATRRFMRQHGGFGGWCSVLSRELVPMNTSRFTLIASVAPALVLLSASQADVIVNQPYDAPYAIGSQYMSDDPTYSAQAFDDFTLTTTTDLSGLTVYGQDAGDDSYNTAVTMQIRSGVGVGAPILFERLGTQVGLDLVFDLTGIQLNAGQYWLSAFVVRPSNGGGGFWFWGQSNTTNGAGAMWQNPGDGYGYGSAPILVSQLSKDSGAYDMAFILEGTAVPAPGALALLGATGLLGRRRRR